MNLKLSQPQVDALTMLGLSADQIDAFEHGEAVVYSMPNAGSVPLIAMIQFDGTAFPHGIVHIDDPGYGVLAFLRFRSRTFSLARLFDLGNVELFGAAVYNEQMAALLRSHGFVPSEQPCPDELGGGTMEVLGRVFEIDEA